MKQHTPFRRAIAMFEAVTAIYEKGLQPLELRQALSELEPYRSRGHGGKHRTKNRQIGARWSQDRNVYKKPHQSGREMARRVRQMNLGFA